jgi:hypothetical protein
MFYLPTIPECAAVKKRFSLGGRLAVAVIIFCGVWRATAAEEKINYQDNVLPIIENNCAKCHNPDKKKGDLDLTTYSGALKGGGSGAVLVSGNLDGSKLWRAVTHAEDPTMPPNKSTLPEKELDVFKRWILGGLLETSGGKAVATAKPTVDLSVKISSLGKPDGPPPMPHHLPLEPLLHTSRTTAITGLANSPWAPLVAVAGQKQIFIYDSDSLQLLGILPFTNGQPAVVQFSRNGKLLIVGGGVGGKSGRVVIWNIETGEKVASIGQEYDTVIAADLSPDQNKIALGGPDRLVKIYSTKTGELLQKIKKHTDWVTTVAFSPNGEILASADRNGGISLWDPENGQELLSFAGHKGAVTQIDWRGDSTVLASSSEDGTIKLWDPSETRPARTWTGHNGGVLAVKYTRDGRLVSCGRDNQITLWDSNGNKKKSFEFFGELPVRAIFTHDGERIVASDFNGRVAVWNAADGKRIGEISANPTPPTKEIAAQKSDPTTP